MSRSRLVLVLVTMLMVGATAEAKGRWGIGIRTTDQAISSDEGDNELKMTGGGLHLRWRVSNRWELELATEKVRAELGGGAFVRESHPVTLSALYRMNPSGRWDYYFLFGFGRTAEELQTMTSYQEVEEAEFHLGVGIEWKAGPIGIAAEARALGLSADDDTDDGNSSWNSALPAESSGTQANLLVTWYF